MKPIIALLITLLLSYCTIHEKQDLIIPYVMVLGIAQDAGYPQINCKKACCKIAWEDSKLQRMTSCLAIIDPITKEQWIIDATPNIKDQLQLLKSKTETDKIDGILLTHAHIGHYTGLMHLGREAIGASKIPVFAMPKMSSFLKENGPWSQLIDLENISLQKLTADSIINLNENIKIKPFLVPHRDEFSETVGYAILIRGKSLIFIPDIDKWEKWETDITKLIQKSDYAFLDATFYKNGEINRDMSEIPHPFVEESISLFSSLEEKEKEKIYFIHFNHTNPLLIEKSFAQKDVLEKGFNLAKEGQIIKF